MNIFIHDEFDPETVAMLQAFYSRSHQSIEDRIYSLGEDKTKIKEALKKYYVGYGHKSIGDCGYTTIFIEGVSLLAAKAIQDFSLYNGQESSTRFIDFQLAEFYHVTSNELSSEIYQNWMSFYKDNFEDFLEHLKKFHVCEDSSNPAVFDKALKAKAFDVFRGFLPCGTQTQLSWTVNLRQLADQLLRLKCHPLEELRILAVLLKEKLILKYPSSFAQDTDHARYRYLSNFNENFTYTLSPTKTDFQYCSSINFDLLKRDSFWLETRPKNTELPPYFNKFGEFMFNFKLDFGSFRDLQRHRNGSCPMPLISKVNCFSAWYLNQLPEPIKTKALTLIYNQTKLIKKLYNCCLMDDSNLQYYYPLGWEVDVEYVAALPQIVYIAELRSSKTVHPTLRAIAQKMATALKNELPQMALYVDFDEVDLCMRRGSQDIIKLSN